MPLDEALRQLLHPEKKEPQEPEEAEEEPPLDDLEQAIDEIESVVDVDMVRGDHREEKAGIVCRKHDRDHTGGR